MFLGLVVVWLGVFLSSKYPCDFWAWKTALDAEVNNAIDTWLLLDLLKVSGKEIQYILVFPVFLMYSTMAQYLKLQNLMKIYQTHENKAIWHAQNPFKKLCFSII